MTETANQMTASVISTPPFATNNRYKLLIAGLQIAMLWRMWDWLWRRNLIHIERPFQWFAVTGILLFYFSLVSSEKKDKNLKEKEPVSRWRFLMPLALTITFNLLVGRIPMILCSIIGIGALTQTLSMLWIDQPFNIGMFGLLCCIFRTIPTIDRCFGYPLRLLATMVSSSILNIAGIDAVREGTGLTWSGYRVFVDGPCSGISMLWTGMFLTFALCLMYRLSQRRIIAAIGGAAIALVGGNVFRIVALFLFECKFFEEKGYTHNLIGIGTYILSTGLIFAMIRKLSPPSTEPCQHQKSYQPQKLTPSILTLPYTAKFVLSSVSAGVSVIAIIAISGLPNYSNQAQEPGTGNNFLWPTHLYEEKLIPAKLSPHETVSFKHFPGAVARFETGKYRVILYHLTEPSRDLHSRILCLEAAGLTVHLEEGFTDQDGHRWTAMRAEKLVTGGLMSIPFKEITFDSKGQSYSTLSEWYWAVFLGKSKGPWLHYSLEEKEILQDTEE